MKTKTDLDKIKQIAFLFLEMPIEIDKKFEFICHHPFIRDTYTPVKCEKTIENPAGVELLDIRKDENLTKVKEFYKEEISKCKKVSHIFFIINKPYSGIFFKYIKDFLNIKDYTNILESLWTTMEYPNTDINVTQKEWIDFWNKADLDYIYSYKDIEFLESLPEEFPVYRGLMQGARKEALSWTLSLSKAKWFARRFNYNGKVYKAICSKKDILAYLSCRNEDEIVVDYKKLKNIEEVNEDLKITDLKIREEISVRLYNCLRINNIKTLEELKEVYKSGKILRFRNLGKKTLEEAHSILLNIFNEDMVIDNDQVL